MFQPRIFRETRVGKLHSMMGQYPFSTLVTSHGSGVKADHVPLLLDPEAGHSGILQGHLAAVNPLCRNDEEEGRDVLAIFHGPVAYVSAGSYPSKKEHNKVVPTWNYVVIHARGKLHFRRDPEWKLRHLNELTNQHETDRDDPWTVSQAPDEFVSRQMRAIVGIEIAIDDLTGTVKISQNKSQDDRNGVIADLGTGAQPAHQAMCDFMSAYYEIDVAGTAEHVPSPSLAPSQSTLPRAEKVLP